VKRRQFMPMQGKKNSEYAQPEIASKSEKPPTYPKKNGSGLLSSYNENIQRPQPIFGSAAPSSPDQLARSTQPFGMAVGKQNPNPASPVLEGKNSLASRATTFDSQIPVQQSPKSFAPSNAPQNPAQQPYLPMTSPVRSIPNFQNRAAPSTTMGVPNNPSNHGLAPLAPEMPNGYPNTGNLVHTGNLANTGNLVNTGSIPFTQARPPMVPNYPAGVTPYTGFPPMQPMPGMRPPYAQFGPPPFGGKSQRRFPIWARIVVGFMAFVLLIAGGFFTYYEVKLAPTLNRIIGKEVIHSKNGTPVSTLDGGASNLNSQNRINILLLGSDTDGKNGAPLAQSDIVVTIDQQTHYVGMLSIPRDLQVSIPGGGEGKMDFAFSYGWQDQRSNDTTADAEAGAGLAEDTIQQNFGIHIDRYAWVGLAGFIKVIDTAGGVDVDVTHPMVDDDYPDDVSNPGGSVYDYQRLYIAPGPQHLNGTQALNYVRTRHSDLIGDFGRSARQQQVLSALKMKLANPDTLSQIPQLLNDLNGYLLTDMQLSDLALLGNLARSVDLNSVQHVTLSPPYSSPSSQNTNYLPNCSQITGVISQMFGIQGNCIPQGDNSAAGALSIASPSPNAQVQTGTISSQGGTHYSQPLTSRQIAVPNFNSMDVVGGVHALLDVMFMTVFQSFNAAQV
jgi:LCP family protein required for cell wall assembly